MKYCDFRLIERTRVQRIFFLKEKIWVFFLFLFVLFFPCDKFFWGLNRKRKKKKKRVKMVR